jgi:ADP-heptose:LPS heptosyltransferase
VKNYSEKYNQREMKEVPSVEIKKLGLSSDGLKHVKKTEELRESPLNLVIAECVQTCEFTQNKFKKQKLKKKKKYVMGLGIYKQLWYDVVSGKKILRPSTVKFKNIYRPYQGQDLTDKKILITRTGGIGDLLFILPNLKYLKEKYPTCKIYFACGPQYQDMVNNWDCVDEILDQPFPFAFLTTSHYHAAFEGVIERAEEAKYTNAYRLFTDWLGLELPDEKLIPVQEPKPLLVDICNNFLTEREQTEGFIILQLRASSPIRSPRPTFWKNIIDGLGKRNYNVIITDTPHMEKDIDKFIETLNPLTQERTRNFSKQSISLDYSIALTSLAKCAISPDSSLIHIATSMSIPAFGIYGAFPGNIRLSTYKNVDWIEPVGIKCSPCFIHGPKPCINSIDSHPVCYDKINVTEILDRVERLIK